MRFLMSARIPTEDGNKMVQDPNFLSKIEKYELYSSSKTLPLNGISNSAAPFCPRTLIVFHIRVSKEIFQNEPGVR